MVKKEMAMIIIMIIKMAAHSSVRKKNSSSRIIQIYKKSSHVTSLLKF